MTLFTIGEEKKMKSNLIRLSLFALICLMSLGSAMATPTCANSSLATTYVNSTGGNNGYVCDINNLQFSNFTDSSPGVDPSSIGVLAITTPGFEGLTFNGPFGVGQNGEPLAEDVSVSFTVTALSGDITDVHIDLFNSSISGTGNVNYTETVCMQTTGCILYVDNPGTSSLSTFLNITPTTSININKDLMLTAGSNGTASMSGFDNYYSHTVPEPRAVSAFLGLAFFGVMVFMKRRQAVRS
jgi:hypothetical protein